MLIRILIVVAVIVVVLLIVVATRPAGFRIVRSVAISAPPARVFEHVNELQKWRAWSPWEDIDPQLQRSYEGPPGGVGAIYKWAGNNKVGAGQMTITQSRRSDLIAIRLDFLRPMKSTNSAEFTFVPQGNETLATWSMSGSCGFAGKAFSMIMNMDKMVGREFAKGLGKLKSVVEAEG